MELDSIIFISSDIARSIEFYTTILGMEVEYQQGEKYASLLFSNGVRLGIKKSQEEREVPGHQTLFVIAPESEMVVANMNQHAISLYTNLKHQPWGDEFSVLDPDGNKVLFIRIQS